jgi:signal peptidase
MLSVWFVALRPVALGGPASFVGVTGFSMEPTFYGGDLVIVHAHRHYSLGDVIAYRVPAGDPGAGHNIIHRIVGGDGVGGFTTQGDNNSYTDVWHPVEGDVIGEVWVEVPNLAEWMGKVRSPGTLALIVGLGAFVAIVVPDRRKQAGSTPPDAGAPNLDDA